MCFSTHKFKAFSSFTNTITRYNSNFCSLRCNKKTSTKFFFVLHHFTNGGFVLAIQPGNIHIRFSITIISRIFGKDITTSLRFRSTTSITLLLCFGAIIRVNKGFLNTNTAITWQLIRTARTLDAEWWQEVCGEAWVRGQRKMSQVLGAFGLLDFSMLWPVLAWRAF